MVKENIVDSRFAGKSVKLYVMGFTEPIEGVIDEVSRYEIGIRARDKALVVFRHAVLYILTQPPELHGYSSEELEDTIITSDFIGEDVEVHLINGEVIKGKLMKISRYELGLVGQDTAYVIPKSSISFIVFKSI